MELKHRRRDRKLAAATDDLTMGVAKKGVLASNACTLCQAYLLRQTCSCSGGALPQLQGVLLMHMVVMTISKLLQFF